MAVELGQRVEDNITGFAGTVTGIAEYITGCRQALVVARVKEDGDFKSHWFDEDRLVDVPESEKRKGGPQSTPPKAN